MTEQQLALKALTEQVEKTRRELEEGRAQLTATESVKSVPPLPQGISDIMSGRSVEHSQPEVKPLNMMDYLRRTMAAKQTTTVMNAPPMPPSMSGRGSSSDPRLNEQPAPPTSDPRHRDADSSSERPKISFSFGSKNRPPQQAHHERLIDEEEPINRPYLPPPTNQPPIGVQMPNQPSPGAGYGPPGGYRNQPNPPIPQQQQGYQSPQRLPFAPNRGGHGFQNNRGGPDFQNNRGPPEFQNNRGGANYNRQREDVDYRHSQQGPNDRRGWQDRGGRDDRPGGYGRPHGQQGYNRGSYQDNRQKPYDRNSQRGGYRRDY